jgi:hypothetical protein
MWIPDSAEVIHGSLKAPKLGKYTKSKKKTFEQGTLQMKLLLGLKNYETITSLC